MAAFRLDRLSAGESVVDSSGRPSQAFQRRIQKAWEKIEAAYDDLSIQLAAIQAAQAAADAAHRNDSISGSWLSPNTVLSAADAGTDASITIANHTRKYGDGTAVSITGTTLTGKSYSTEYHVYYDDAARVGGAVTLLSTVNPNGAANNAQTGRHYVGSITTPAALAAPTAAPGSRPPGYTGTGSIP